METNYNTDLFNSIIQNRHSVLPNQFIKGKAVSDEIIWQILENANRAPNHKHTEAKLKNLVEYPLMSSHVIAIGMKRNEEQKLPEIEEIIGTACAIENMYLT